MHIFRRRKEAGITLQEILLVMAIMGIIFAVAIPNFTGMLRAHRVKTVVNEVVGGMNLARQMAITSGDKYEAGVLGGVTDRWQVKNMTTDEIVREGRLPEGVTIATAASFEFTPLGACDTPTTYSGSTPATRFLQFEIAVSPSRSDRYTVEVSAAGRIATSVEHLSS